MSIGEEGTKSQDLTSGQIIATQITTSIFFSVKYLKEEVSQSQGILRELWL